MLLFVLMIMDIMQTAFSTDFYSFLVNHATMEKNHAMKKERHKELLDDDFDDYDSDHYYERYFLYLYTITWYFL